MATGAAAILIAVPVQLLVLPFKDKLCKTIKPLLSCIYRIANQVH